MRSSDEPRAARRTPVARLATLAALAALLPSTGCVLLPTLRGAPPPLEAPPGAPPAGGESLLDVRGIVHCHSALSHDSEGTLEEIAAAAHGAGVRFLAMTDHYTPRAIREGFRGVKDDVIFFVGIEVSRDHGSLLAIGLGEPLPAAPAPAPAVLASAPHAEATTATAVSTLAPPPPDPRAPPRPPADPRLPDLAPLLTDHLGASQEVVDKVRTTRGLVFIGHAEAFTRWDLANFDGLEVYNLHANATEASKAKMLLAGLFLPPGAFFDAIFERPTEVLARWDDLCKKRRVPGVGGCDAHQNTGPIARYGECFRVVTTHVLVRTVTPEAILEALREGRAYVAFEVDGDATGFTFDLVDARRRVVARMGEERAVGRGERLVARAPGDARLAIFRDGTLLAEVDGGGLLDVPAAVPGVYRVEAYRDGRLFVLSNPIYLR
jgi:hypothetical protein